MYLEAPTPAPTQAPAAGSSTTPAAELIAAVITQEVTFKTLDPNTYPGDVKNTFETGYGISIEIYDTAAKAYKKGNKVESSATATRRAGAKVMFKASVTAAHSAIAQSAAKALVANPAPLISAISSAKTILGTTVTVPSAADVTVAAPAIAVTPTSSTTGVLSPGTTSDDLSAAWGVFIAVCCVCAVLIVGCIVWDKFATHTTTSPPASTATGKLELPAATLEKEKEKQIGVELDTVYVHTVGEEKTEGEELELKTEGEELELPAAALEKEKQIGVESPNQQPWAFEVVTEAQHHQVQQHDAHKTCGISELDTVHAHTKTEGEEWM
jgi:hypothetical protein